MQQHLPELVLQLPPDQQAGATQQAIGGLIQNKGIPEAEGRQLLQDPAGLQTWLQYHAHTCMHRLRRKESQATRAELVSAITDTIPDQSRRDPHSAYICPVEKRNEIVTFEKHERVKRQT
jgi:hypothetical protein